MKLAILFFLCLTSLFCPGANGAAVASANSGIEASLTIETDDISDLIEAGTDDLPTQGTGDRPCGLAHCPGIGTGEAYDASDLSFRPGKIRPSSHLLLRGRDLDPAERPPSIPAV